MRKTSQDGGDNTSITSGVENEIKKPIVGIIKTKRNSIKRKVQNFSHESDDAAIEPLLQKEKDKTEISNQSAKIFLEKTKTESSSEKGDDRDKLLSDDRVEEPSLSNAPSGISSTSIKNGTKETIHHQQKLYESSSTLHNHMNTNIFGSVDGVKNIITPKSQILVEIESKPTGYNPSSLIFTTAKIHKEGNTKQMEPVQVTPVPILSTIEGSAKIGVNSSDKVISGVANTGNNVINNVCVKLNHTDLNTPRDIQNTKTSASISNSSHSAILCTLSNNMHSEKKDGTNSKNVVTSNNILANNIMKPVVSIDINTIPAKTIKSDFNTDDSNASTTCSFDNKDPSKTCESLVDVNKNIEINRTISPIGRSSDSSMGTMSPSYVEKKQLPIAKNATEQDKNRDLSKYRKNNDSKDKKESVEKVNIEPRKALSSESSIINTNENKSIPKPVTAISTCMSTNSIASVNYIPTSTKTFSIQTSKDNLPLQNIPLVTQIPGVNAKTSTKMDGSTIPSKPTISTSTSSASKPVSTISIAANSTTTNVISTENTIVSKELPSIKPATTEVSKTSLEISCTKISVTTSSPKIKSTVSTIISTPKPTAQKNVPPTSSVKNATNVIKTSSTQPSASNVSVSVVNTAIDSISTKAMKPGTSANSKPNNVTKIVSSTVDPSKSFNIPQTNAVPSSSGTSSKISVSKTQENSTQDLKSTSSVLKPSTTITTPKPSIVSTVLPSNSKKQSSTKTSVTKSNSGTVSSVKTLITLSDKPSSNSGSVKLVTSKPSNKTEHKSVDGKNA